MARNQSALESTDLGAPNGASNSEIQPLGSDLLSFKVSHLSVDRNEKLTILQYENYSATPRVLDLPCLWHMFSPLGSSRKFFGGLEAHTCMFYKKNFSKVLSAPSLNYAIIITLKYSQIWPDLKIRSTLFKPPTLNWKLIYKTETLKKLLKYSVHFKRSDLDHR